MPSTLPSTFEAPAISERSLERSNNDLDCLGIATTKAARTEKIMKDVYTIQDLALQTDIAIVLTELQFMRADYDRVKHLLEKKELEVQSLREMIKQSNQQISCLELERELAQGEAAKWKDDLQSLISNFSNGSNTPRDKTVIDHAKSLNRYPISKGLLSPCVQRSNKQSCSRMQQGKKNTNRLVISPEESRDDVTWRPVKDTIDGRKEVPSASFIRMIHATKGQDQGQTSSNADDSLMSHQRIMEVSSHQPQATSTLRRRRS